MKWGNKVVLVLFVVVFLFSFLPVMPVQNVFGSVSGWYSGPNVYAVIVGNGYFEMREVVSSTDADVCAVGYTLTSLQYTVNSFMVDNNSVSGVTVSAIYVYRPSNSSSNLVLDITFYKSAYTFGNSSSSIQYSVSFSGVMKDLANNTYNVSGSVSAKGVRTSTNVQYSWYLFNVFTVSVSASYNNDFNCDLKTASFSITSQNFNIESIDQVQWNMQTSALIQSYTVSNLTSSSATVNVVFYNIPNGVYYIRFWVTGHTVEDNVYETISADTSFTVSCASQVVSQGHLVIVQPPEVFNTSVDATGKVTTTFSLTYGGNFASDYNGRTLTFKIISVKSSTTENLLTFFTDFSFANQNWTYNSANNESYSTYSVTWVNGADLNYGCDVIFQAIVSNGFFNLLHSDNTVEIIVGSPPSSTGNPLLDWLIKVWGEFKQWFVDTLKWLFVPTTDQLESINIVGNGSSGAVDVIKQYMPFLNLSQYAKSSFTLIDFNNLNFTYTINNKTSTIKAGNEKLTIDLNDSRVSSFLSYVKIGADILVSLALILLLYEVLK